MKLENVIYSGDNLTWLKKFFDKCLDLIYKQYEAIFNDGEKINSSKDNWKGGIR